ncbi:ESX secretion-associated protein EspG [Nocardia nepalensis]|uniref:ESX secretion-associated protein EspG n=1 Tax=Nocardia nepalensis TaxID=3375448 RepID=UPI003B67C5D4
MSWRLTDLEFVSAWADLKEDSLPYPFIFTSRTPLWNDYLREQQEVRQRLRSELDESKWDVLRMLSSCDIRLEVAGWDARDPENPQGCVRLLAARRGGQAVLVTQLPGETVRHSGGYVFTECEAVALADAVVDALPKSDPGGRAQVVLAGLDDEDDTDYSYGRSEIFDSFEDEAGHRAKAFLDEPVSMIGLINVIQGHSRFGPRGITRHQLAWRDLVDDGRYVIDDQNPPVAIGVDAKRMTTVINTRIAEVVRAIKDERA